jgi:hypothetical protein
MPPGEENPDRSGEAEALEHLAWECLFHGRLAEAIDYHRQALAARERAFGPDHWEVANSLIVLAGVIGRGDSALPEVEALTRRAAGIYESLVRRLEAEGGEPFDHAIQGLLGALTNLALIAEDRGDLDAAEAGYRDIQGRLERHYGPDRGYIHPSLAGFAHLLIRRGKAAEAESILRAAVAQAVGAGRGDEWGVPDCEEVLAELCAGQGRGAEAEQLYRSAVARRERIAGDGWPASAGAAAHALRGLARLCRGAGRAGEADELERRADEFAPAGRGADVGGGRRGEAEGGR